jgi:hypothetical protein
MAGAGSKPGERRGGRQKGSLNKSTIRRAAQHVMAVELTVERIKAEYSKIAMSKSAKVNTRDKLHALDSMGKHLGMFIDRIAGPDGRTPVQPAQIIVQYFDKPSPSASPDSPIS